MINFIEQRFPDDIAYGSAGGPEYSTDVVLSSNGYEQRNINWSYARHKYNIVPGIKTQEQMQQVLAFFRMCKGRALGFRFKDWSDYQASQQEIGVGNGEEKRFQLVKRYTLSASLVESRLIYKPVQGSIKIYLDGQLEEGVMVDCQSGQVLFETPPGEGVQITADFQFDVPVRFDIDYLPTLIEARNIYSFGIIPLIEVRCF